MDNAAPSPVSGHENAQVNRPMTLDDRSKVRLRELFDECLVLLALERGRSGSRAGARDRRDWMGQCRRVATVLSGRDIYVRDTMKRLEELMDYPPARKEIGFDGFLKHVQRAREERFCQMVGILEADGTLPLAE